MSTKAVIPKVYFDRQEAALYLSVSLTYIDFLIDSGFIQIVEMPHIKRSRGRRKIRKFLRIEKRDLDIFMESLKISNKSEKNASKDIIADIHKV